MITTYQTRTEFGTCAICKRETSGSHATKYLDLWICHWCDK